MIVLPLKNIKLIGIVTVIIACFSAGWWVRGGICETARLKLENAAAEEALAKTAKYNEIAGEFEKLKADNANTKAKLRERVRNAKDSSFGCHVDADGVQLINDSKNTRNSGQPDQ